MNPLSFLKKKKVDPDKIPRRKPFRPIVERRIDSTERFFSRVLRMAERQALSHNLKKPYPEDHSAVILIAEVSELATRNRGRLRQEELFKK